MREEIARLIAKHWWEQWMLGRENSDATKISIDDRDLADKIVEIVRRDDPDMVMLPRALTAENWAKALLTGEFFETFRVRCQTCSQNCEECELDTEMHKVPVSWTTIKAIYKMIVEHFGK
jgi:hypothetical protein